MHVSIALLIVAVALFAVAVITVLPGRGGSTGGALLFITVAIVLFALAEAFSRLPVGSAW